MIKVNLLKDQTVQTRRTFVKPTVSRIGLIFSAILILAVSGMAAWTLSVQHQIKTGIDKRRVLRAEEARLQSLQKEIEKYEQLKRLRQNRIDVIENLKENQKGPVLLLNTVIQSIPKDGMLWLTSVSQKSDNIKIVGFTQHPEVIPDFMNDLALSGFFRSVDLELMERQSEATKFSLICVSTTKPQAE